MGARPSHLPKAIEISMEHEAVVVQLSVTTVQGAVHTFVIPEVCSSLRVFSEKFHRRRPQCCDKLGQMSSIIKIAIIVTCSKQSFWLQKVPRLLTELELVPGHSGMNTADEYTYREANAPYIDWIAPAYIK